MLGWPGALPPADSIRNQLQIDQPTQSLCMESCIAYLILYRDAKLPQLQDKAEFQKESYKEARMMDANTKSKNELKARKT